MFAVPGWSLSADKLKTETAASPAAAGPGATASTPPSRKRKRPSKGPSEVTRENVAALWEKIIEQKEPSASSKKPSAPKDGSKKRQKVNKPDRKDDGTAQTRPASSSQPQATGKSAEPSPASAVKPEGEPAKAQDRKKDKKDKKKHNKKKDDEETQEGNGEAKPEQQQKKPAPAPAPAPPQPVAVVPKLTPLQASMRAKLISARFRHLNETLYTRPSAEAFELFGESPDMFAEYHEGFRQQVGVWPENPVDGYIADIRARAAVWPPQSSFRGGRGGGRGGRQQQQKQRREEAFEAAQAGGAEPLPRTAGECTVADLGCGDGRLGGELQGPTAERLRLKVLSFDLQSPAPHVTKADMAALPLEDGSVNVAIFCLALMGTNWPAFVEEAYRILHWKGELWVAEIKSRFSPPGARKKGAPGGGVVEHSVGNRRKKATAAVKKSLAADEAQAAASQAEALAVEVDGADDRRGETDVSAFVEVLARRGFVLHGEGADAIDLSNKMFVKMRFLKAAAPTVGKGVPKEKQQPAGSADARGPSKKKFIDTAEPLNAAEEAKVLKPCVYKIR